MAKNTLEKNIRQIEIVALCSEVQITKTNLEDAYGVSADLIKTDLRNMLAEGLEINSQGKKGIIVGNLEKFVNDKIAFYLRLRNFNVIDEKAIDSMVEVLGTKALYFLVALFKQIEHSRTISICYGEKSYNISQIEPLSIWYANDDYRLIARADGKIKQYSLKKINTIDFSGQFYNRIENNDLQDYLKISIINSNSEVDEMKRYSWGGWVGSERINVTLTLSGNKKDCIILADQRQLACDNRSNTINGFVNSITEFAKYIVAHHPNIKALDPPALIDEVKRIAKAVTKYYK